MDPLPYAADYARTESISILDRLARELPRVYRSLGYEVVSVPVGTIENRIERIVREISEEIDSGTQS